MNSSIARRTDAERPPDGTDSPSIEGSDLDARCKGRILFFDGLISHFYADLAEMPPRLHQFEGFFELAECKCSVDDGMQTMV